MRLNARSRWGGRSSRFNCGEAHLGENLEVKYTPTKEIRILSIDERSLDKMLWCSVASGVNKIQWINGYALCLEIHDKAFEHEIERGVFIINQVCYSKLPNYTPLYDIKGRIEVPIVDVSEMKFYKSIHSLIVGLNSNKEEE